jgi:fructose-1,6-bisphosphatase/inositol monophosphatase family enzyme
MLKLLQGISVAQNRQFDRSQARSTAMKSMLASMAVVLTLCTAPAAAAEFPKTGSAEYDTYYVDNVVAKIDSGAGTGVIGEETGITRNVKGEGPFHDMSVRCLYHWSRGGRDKSR